jgi:hypothetical protein
MEIKIIEAKSENFSDEELAVKINDLFVKRMRTQGVVYTSSFIRYVEHTDSWKLEVDCANDDYTAAIGVFLYYISKLKTVYVSFRLNDERGINIHKLGSNNFDDVYEELNLVTFEVND